MSTPVKGRGFESDDSLLLANNSIILSFLEDEIIRSCLLISDVLQKSQFVSREEMCRERYLKQVLLHLV